MPLPLEVLVAALCLGGTGLIVLTGVGLVRFPDVYCRMHAAGKAGTLGVVLLVLGATVAFAGSDQDVWMRGLLAVGFQFLTAPAATHLLARAAYIGDYPLATATAVDELRAYLEPPRGAQWGGIADREESTMLTRILVGLDNTANTDAAVRQAIEMAQRHRAHLTGLVVVDTRALDSVGPMPIGGSYYAKRLREHRRDSAAVQSESAIARFTAACAAGGVNHEVKQLTENPFDAFAMQARYHDVMVLGVGFLFYHGIIAEPRDPLGRLMKRGMRPLIVVAPEARSIRHVLIAYNDSIEATLAMKQFVHMGPWPEVSAQLVWCGAEAGGDTALLREARAYCQSHGLPTEVADAPTREGAPLLTYAAQCRTDLLVVGNSARELPHPAFFGDPALGPHDPRTVSLFLNQ